jgi:hypothetical protein
MRFWAYLIILTLVGCVLWDARPAKAQVPAYRGYPVLYGCLYVSAQGFMVIREVGIQPTPEQCR